MNPRGKPGRSSPPPRRWLRTFALFAAALALALVTRSTAAEPLPFSFGTRILPLLTKAGCNTGECHGAAVGQGGFRLSLLGYDAQQDHLNITRELGGRRIDLGNPGDSLLLRKPTRQVKHKGGRIFAVGSEEHRELLEWIRDGAPAGDPELRVTAIEVEPELVRLPATGASAPLRVFARMSDGRREEVTERALFDSNDDGTVSVAEDGTVTAESRGVSSIMIRYGGQVAAARVGVPLQDTAPTADPLADGNFIDRSVSRELRRWNIPVSPPAKPEEFLRRVSLDLTGRLPSPADVRRFLRADGSGQSREQVVDHLLATPAFVDLWTTRLADVLLISPRRHGPQGTRVYHAWLREQVARDTPVDRIARELLTGLGDTTKIGPANFYRISSDPRDMGEFVSRSLLGMRIACARCHNHPFDRWSMADYHRFASFFSRTAWSGPRIVLRDRGEIEHPKTGRPMPPRALGQDLLIPADSDRREPLADWLTAPENPFFARAFVNRVWNHLFGVGIVEPVDDLRVTNPPANPELLDKLARHFSTNGHDLRELIRTIVTSRTYGVSSRPEGVNRHDRRRFSHARLKPLRAQVLADVIARATGVPLRFADQSEATWATELPDVQLESYTLDVLGRCPRTDSCASPDDFGGGLTQALHFINGAPINANIREGARRLAERIPDDRDAIVELHFRTLSRPPTEAELRNWTDALAKAGSRAEFLEDLMWALINSREFAHNH